jgi:hypothetical protein
MQSLYKIEQRFLELSYQLEVATQRIEAEEVGADDEYMRISAELEELIKTEIQKVDSVAGFVRYCERNAEVAKAEADRLNARSRMWLNTSDKLKQRIIQAMDLTDTKQLRGACNTITLAKNGGAQPLEIDDNLLPAAFLQQVISYKPNRDAIKAALKAGEQIPGVKLIERGRHLKIE